MLSEVETRLAEAMRKALPSDAVVSSGPPPVPAAGMKKAANVWAAGLKTITPDGEDQEGKRDAAYRAQTYALEGDGKRLDFPLPQDAKGELAEVEISPGRLARAGDQCWLEGGQLRFYRPPAGKFNAVLRGDRAQGYRESIKGSATLVLTVIGEQLADCDELANVSLAALLSYFVALDFVGLAEVSALGFNMRLLKPQAELIGLERDAVAVDNSRLYRGIIKLELRGDLETSLAAGAPEEEGIIEKIEGKLDVASGQRVIREFKVEKQ